MPAIIFALISYFGWGTSDIFITVASRKIGAYATTFWSTLLGFILFSIYAPFVIADLRHITLSVLSISLSLGVIWTISLFSLNKALSMANPSVVGTIGYSWGVISVLCSILFLSEKITAIQICTICLIFIGIILASIDITSVVKDKKLFLHKGVIFALIAMIGWGIYGAFLKIPVKNIGWFWPLYMTYGVSPLLIFSFMKIKKIKLSLPTYNNALSSVVSGSVLSRIAELSYYVGVSRGFVAIIAPIAGSYSTLFVVLSFFIFRERITKQQIAGVILTVCGIVYLAFTSG